MATNTRPSAAKLPISTPPADLTPEPAVGGGVPDRVPFVVPLLGFAEGVALAYVQPEKLTKTLSLELVVREQSQANVAVVVLVVPFPETVREGKDVTVGAERELVMEPEPLEGEDVALLVTGNGWFLVVRVVGRADDDMGLAIVRIVYGGRRASEKSDEVSWRWPTRGDEVRLQAYESVGYDDGDKE